MEWQGIVQRLWNIVVIVQGKIFGILFIIGSLSIRVAIARFLSVYE